MLISAVEKTDSSAAVSKRAPAVLHSAASEMSELLNAWSDGNRDVPTRIVERAYFELHRIAQRCVDKGRPVPSIQATALVNEAHLKPIEVQRMEWEDRHTFRCRGRHYAPHPGGPTAEEIAGFLREMTHAAFK